MQPESSAEPVKTSSRSIAPQLAFHPDFCSEDANVIIAAKDAKMYFRVHSYTLKSTSGFFETMFSLPQTEANEDIIYLDEDAATLEHLLRMICGMPVLAIESHDMLDSILSAAEKYIMPGPLSLIRVLIMQTPSPLKDVLRLYAVAYRNQWIDEARILSGRTLMLQLEDDAHLTSLRTLSVEALLDLFKLHKRRTKLFQEYLNSPPFVSGSPQICTECAALITYSSWKMLKFRMIIEMNDRPLGDTIVQSGLYTWLEAKMCWRAVCGNEVCKRPLYDQSETIHVIRECINKLPKTILEGKTLVL